MSTLLRRLASPSLFTTLLSTDGISAFNGRPQGASRPGQDERQASVGAAQILQLSTIVIDMQVKGFVSHTRVVQKFLSTDDSRAVEASCSFRIPDEAAITSFKLEIGDDHAIEDESRPYKRAKTIYNQTIQNKIPAAVLREVGSGVFEANLGHIPPDVEVSIVVNFAERIQFNARGDLIIKYPALSPLSWSSSSEDTRISLKIEIIQRGLITISSPTHQKLLSINTGVMSAVRDAESFASLQKPAEQSDSDRPNSASVSLSANRNALQKDFELVIETSNEAQRTIASLFTTNRFGHAVLFVTFRPCDLFIGEQDIQWSININLDHPWNHCSFDLREMNLTRIQARATSLSPSKFHFIQSPRLIPKISHWQSYSAFFLLDFGNSSDLFLDSVSITATSTRNIYTTSLSVERTNTTDSTLQKLCVSSILRDTQRTLMSKKPHHSFTDSRSLCSSSLVKSAERLGQMYSVCNHWTSKIAADSIRDFDDDVDSNGPPIFEDDLSRLALPTDFSFADSGVLSLPHSDRDSKPKKQQRNRSPAESEDDEDEDDGGLLVEYPEPAPSGPIRGQDFSPTFPPAIRRFSEFVHDEGPGSDKDADAEYDEDDILGEEEDDVSGKGSNSFKLPQPVTAGEIDIIDGDFEKELEKELSSQAGNTESDVSEDDGVWGEGGNGFKLPQPVTAGEIDIIYDGFEGDFEKELEKELGSQAGSTESDVSEDDGVLGEGGNGFGLPTPVTAAASVSHRRSNQSPKGSNADSGSVCNLHGVSVTERLPPLISDSSVGRATPVEERLPYNSIESASYIPEAEPFNFSTLPQEIHLDELDGLGYADYVPVADAPPTVDPGLENSSIAFQDASTTDSPPPTSQMDHFSPNPHARPQQQQQQQQGSPALHQQQHYPNSVAPSPPLFLSTDTPTLPSMAHFTGAYRVPNPNTGNASFEPVSSCEEEDRRIGQSHASYFHLSSNTTYTLQEDLRNRIENRFSSGTRVWLVERIEASTHSIYHPSVLEAVVDTMLVLAFVKVCLAQRYDEVEKHVGLIMDIWQNQRMILDELTLRIMGEGNDDREESDKALSTAVLKTLSI